jgi:EamA domain-containing membrane protein RarD
MLAVVFMGGFAATWAAVRGKGVAWALVLSAACIACNWTTYVWLVAHAG